MGRERIVRILGVALLLVAVTGATGCDKIRDAVDGLRRSTGQGWEQGRRRIGG